MKPRILVIYYTQTGQLKHILDHITQPLENEATINWLEIKPEKPFPFPWNPYKFFDAMPECVERIPGAFALSDHNLIEEKFDLIILGYQPWFLNPSQPTTSFLKSSETKKILYGNNVMTVIGSRNMWLNAQEEVKKDLKDAGAKLVGNIVFKDDHTNLVSLLTVIRWSFKGQKERSAWLPEAGVSTADINDAEKFAAPVLTALQTNDYSKLHPQLLEIDAVELDPGLILLEQRGIKNFRYWAKYIREKGGPGDPARASRVNLFKRLLLTAIFVLSPASALSAAIKKRLKRDKLKEDAVYFRGIDYQKGKI